MQHAGPGPTQTSARGSHHDPPPAAPDTLAPGRRRRDWHVTSQQRARRNALVASTALTASRRERMDVEDFLAEHAARFEVSRTSARPVSHIA